MSPLQIKLLLHIYCCRAPFEGPTVGSAPHNEALLWFLKEGLIEKVPELQAENDNGYEVTEKGRFYCEAICNIPLPVTQWILPD